MADRYHQLRQTLPLSLASVALLALLFLSACPPKAPVFEGDYAPTAQSAEPALTALRAGDFERVRTATDRVLANQPNHAQAAAARAFARFQGAMHHLRAEAMGVLDTADRQSGFDHQRMRAALERTAGALALADGDLAIAERDRNFALELCMACWERDWNHSGEVDARERRLFQIEIDGAGRPIPEGDPRRVPTFRFDVGDVMWARAMLSFQQAALELVLAYRWTELNLLLGSMRSLKGGRIAIRLEQPERVARARALILAGLQHAERSRRAYLAETDDDREWVPNPRQRNHPLPLPVDDQLYRVWAGVLGDAERLIAGTEALSVAEIAQLGDDQWRDPPGGYIDVGQMLARPKDIIINMVDLERTWDDPARGRKAQVEDTLVSLLGAYYDRRGQRQASSLVRRLARMKSEMERGEDTLERKLRYLLWLN